MELEWNTTYVVILFIFTLFVSTICFDMIANWEHKKVEDTRLLLLGAGGFALAILLFSNAKVALLAGVAIAVTVLAGLMAVDNRFETSKEPWELYLMAIISLLALVGTLIYMYYNTNAGKYVQKKGSEIKSGLEKIREKRRMRKQQNLNNTNEIFNPMFNQT